MQDSKGDGPFSDPGKLEALFGELGPEPVELLPAVDSIDDERRCKNKNVDSTYLCANAILL